MCHFTASADTAVNFIFPNMILNRSGPLLLTNAVRPTGPATCAVRFDWFLDPAFADQQDLIDRVRPLTSTLTPALTLSLDEQFNEEHRIACSCELLDMHDQRRAIV